MAWTVILFWLCWKPSIMRLTASPLTPDMECQKTMLLAGATGVAGAWATGCPPPPPCCPPHAASRLALVAARAPIRKLRRLHRSISGPPLAFDGARRQPAHQVALPEHEQQQRGQ